MDHIITAVFEPGKIRTVASEPLFQWDYGQTLVFSGLDLPTAYQVDFSNFEYCGNSIPQIGGAEGVTVPVDVLTTGRDVYAFVWIQDAESGRTRVMAQIPVIPRPVPDIDDPNPEQESAIAEAIAALNAGVAAAEAAQAAAEQSAEEAGTSAQAAAGSAAEAAGSATEAGSARDAAQAAQAAAEAAQTAAEQSAGNAGASAQAAAGSAAAAAGSASEAGSAVQAAEAAQAAAEAAEEAAVQLAVAAGESAQAAAGSAAAAAGSVTDAGSAASAALQSAVAAGESAQAAAQSATNAGSAASAAAASATAAGNAQTAAETAQGKAEDAQEAAETAQGAAEAAAASVSASAAQIAQNTADIASLKEDRYKAYATDTASGAIASFDDGADDIPVKNLVVDIEPVQSGTGDPSPDNVRPISGWPGATVTRTGKNLCGESFTHGIYSAANGVYYSHEGTSTRYVSVGIVPVKGGQTYTMSWDNDADNTASVSAIVFFSGTNYLSYVQEQNPFTVPDGADRIAVNMFLTTAISSISDVSIAKPQLELGSTASAYEPYQGDTYDITFPDAAGTVYGATVDPIKGKMTVGMAIVDMGTLNWLYYSAQQRFVAQVNSGKPAAANVGLDGACSVYKVVNTGYQLAPDKSVVIGNNFISNQYAAMVVHDEDYTDAATFKTAVSGQTLVFPIETPVTYQLTPTEVTTLLAQNNIWADCGDSTVEYRADTSLYVDKKIAALAAALS